MSELVEFEAPISTRCQHCIWSGNADILGAFVVADCGRHEAHTNQEISHADHAALSFDGLLQSILQTWGDKLTVIVTDKIGSEASHELDQPISLSTRELRAVVALLDTARDRLEGLINDVRIVRAIANDTDNELRKLQARLKR